MNAHGPLPPIPSQPPLVITAREKPQYPEGGKKLISAGTLNSPVQVASLTQQEGSSRKSTVLLSSPGRLVQGAQQAGNDYTGIAARVTFGSEKGAETLWTGVPAVVPCQGSRIIVEAMLVPLPYRFGIAANGILGPNVYGPLPSIGTVSASDPGIDVNAYIIDDWADGPVDNILASVTAPTNNTTPSVLGPVYVTAIKFANRNTSGVQFALMDRNGGNAATYPVVDTFYAPGQSTTGYAIEQPFFRGVVAFACTNWLVPAVYDANGADVQVTIFGYVLTPR